MLVLTKLLVIKNNASPLSKGASSSLLIIFFTEYRGKSVEQEGMIAIFNCYYL
jgi:hypothetical protein